MIDQIILKGLSDAINPYLTAYDTYRKTLKISNLLYGKLSDVFKRSYYDIDEIYKEYKKGVIYDGQLIETGGVFIKYGQIFKPYTHIYGMFNNAKKNEPERKFVNGRFVEDASINMTSKTFQLPVQKLPNFEDLGCGFLYPENFKTFEHERSTVDSEMGIGIAGNQYMIEENSKPMFVIYDLSEFEKMINHKVIVRARVVKMPFNLITKIVDVLDNSIREICSNYIDLTEENANFICLLLKGDGVKAEIDSNIDLLDLSIPIYTESKLSKISNFSAQNEIVDLIASILPNTPQKIDRSFPIVIANTHNNVGNAFISTDEINVVYREPGIIGFYTTAKVYNKSEYETRLSQLSAMYTNFCIDYRNITRKEFGEKGNVSLNFIFDYEKSLLFDKKGLLYDDEVVEAIKDHEHYLTKDWLINK